MGRPRVALVTGAGRPEGIGAAVVGRLRAEGLDVLAHSWPDAGGDVVADLSLPDAPAALADAACARFGGLDVLVVCHARSENQTLDEVTPDELDRHFAANARAAVLLVQAFARRCPGPGRVVLMTSGQHLGPMPGEVPYVLSKAAIQGVAATLADELADRGITVNAVNPGPVDTGWPDDALRERLAARFPAGRWGLPGDVAEVVVWLASPAAAWVTGQTINAEGGFRRG